MDRPFRRMLYWPQVPVGVRRRTSSKSSLHFSLAFCFPFLYAFLFDSVSFFTAILYSLLPLLFSIEFFWTSISHPSLYLYLSLILIKSDVPFLSIYIKIFISAIYLIIAFHLCESNFSSSHLLIVF